jgi:hypothetical protein
MRVKWWHQPQEKTRLRIGSQSPASKKKKGQEKTAIPALPKRYFYIAETDSIICMLKVDNTLVKSRSTFSVAVNMRIKQKM